MTQLVKFHMDFADFNMKMNLKNYSITGKMPDEQIVIACTKYYAVLEILPSVERDV